MTKRNQTTKESRPKTGKRRLHPIPVLIFLFLAIAFLSSAYQLYELHQQVNQSIAKLNHEKESLIDDQKRLEEEILMLNTPGYIEQLAREQLGLVRKGEIRIAPKME